jgi:hypothetical protein
MRVSVAMGMLVSSKVASLFIPILLGQAVDMVSKGTFSLKRDIGPACCLWWFAGVGAVVF